MEREIDWKKRATDWMEIAKRLHGEVDTIKAENARLRSALEFAANSYREMATDEALSQMLYEVANIAKQALAGKEGE